MRRLLGISCLCLLAAVLAAPPTAEAQGAALKLFGGYNTFGSGDVDPGLKGAQDLITALGEAFGWTATAEFKSLNSAWDTGGDFVFYFTPNFGLGLGAGYIQTFPAKSQTDFTHSGLTPLAFTADPKASAIPIRASLYVTIPMGPVISLTLHGGASYYLAKFNWTQRFGSTTSWDQVEIKTDGKGIGFHGGVGLELNLTPNLGLIVEGTGRLAKLDNFTGTSTNTHSIGPASTDTGTLYYYELSGGTLGTLGFLELSDTVPSGSGLSNVRKAKVDFSGFAGRFGLIFRF
jgi:opacity protein-like surface antigen